VTVAWKSQGERGSRFAIRLMVWLALVMGRPVARALLYPICVYYLSRSRQANDALRNFYRHACGRPVTWGGLFHHYYWFASTILDRLYFLRGQVDRFNIQLHGLEVLDRALAKGRGCLLLGSHLGSFEVVRAIGLSRDHTEVRVLMDEGNAPMMRELSQALNPAVAAAVIQVGGAETMLHVKECVDRGGVVGIMGDRLMAEDRSVPCRFLGEAAPFPTGTMRLAHATQTPVVMFFGLYRGGSRYDVYLELLSESVQLTSDDRQDEITRWTQRYADRLAQYSRDTPDNWFNFYDFWGSSH